MRAMLIKGTLEEYELVTSKEIPPDLVTSREIVRLAIRTAIPAYENSDEFMGAVKQQFPIYSDETLVISKEYSDYYHLDMQLDMECEQPRYFVEIDHDIGKFGELILTEEFGYCLLLNIQSNRWSPSSVSTAELSRYVDKIVGELYSPTRRPIDSEISRAASEYSIKIHKAFMDHENAYYQGVFDDAE